MKEALINLLENFGYPVFLQGSMLPDQQYPDSFFTFWNNSTDGDSFYDNKEGAYIWDFDLNFYSSDPQLVNTKLMEAKSILKANGWTVTGAGYDVASDEDTHTGRGINCLYRDNL